MGIIAAVPVRQALAVHLVGDVLAQFGEAIAAAEAGIEQGKTIAGGLFDIYAAEVQQAHDSARHTLDDAFRTAAADAVPVKGVSQQACDNLFAQLETAGYDQDQDFSREAQIAQTLFELKRNEQIVESARIQTLLLRRTVEWDTTLPAFFEGLRTFISNAYQEELKPITRAVDWAQTGLDVIGVIDPTGLADGINGVIHLIRGNYLDATLSFISVLPYAGDLLAKGGKTLLRVAEGLKAARSATSVATDLCFLGRVANRLHLGPVARFLGIACFTEDTEVVVGINADGTLQTRRISELQVGDLVLARSESDASDDLELQPITEIHVGTSDHLRLLTLETSTGDAELIRTTDSHPFYVLDRGWILAADLLPGDRLLETDGSITTVTSTLREDHPEGIAVYNLTVSRDHTYFVDDSVDGGAVWVHNRCSPLRCALRRAGVWGGNSTAQAAHIVPKFGYSFNQAVSNATRDARAILKRFSIGIDSHWNGFMAPVGHMGSHTEKYLLDMADRLTRASAGGIRAQVLRELQSIRFDLLMGKYL